MRIILIHIIVALLLGFWSNGVAAQDGEFRSLEPFERVLMKGNWDVILEQGTEASIRMAAKDMKKLDKVEVKVENQQLNPERWKNRTTAINSGNIFPLFERIPSTLSPDIEVRSGGVSRIFVYSELAQQFLNQNLENNLKKFIFQKLTQTVIKFLKR